MKTFADLDNKNEVTQAIYDYRPGYAFPAVQSSKDEFVWDVRSAVDRFDPDDRKDHGMLQHFGCLDAFLE